MANAHPIQEQHFHQHDAIKSGINGTLLGGAVGFIYAAVQNSLAKTNVGPWGVFTRSGGNIAMFSTSAPSPIEPFKLAPASSQSGGRGAESRGAEGAAAVTAVYTFSKDATANLREKDDTLNVTIASFLSGATIGLRTGRIPQILGIGAAFSVLMSTFEYTGGTLRGKPRGEIPEIDEYERKEYLRKNRRRPIEEAISNIGEGRGIQPQGYEERRRERLKEKYGIEVNPVSATVE
ncbi:hypothetical protein AAE478_010120 [Parahypoxylon ruwenzoriense]